MPVLRNVTKRKIKNLKNYECDGEMSYVYSKRGYMIATERYKPEAVQPACAPGIFPPGPSKKVSCLANILRQ
jgi:hypothetical protein